MKNELNGTEKINQINSYNDLNNLLKDKKTKNIFETPGLTYFKKSRFYYNKGVLREYIASYKDYAIMLDHNNLKNDLGDNKTEMFPILIKVSDVHLLKKVNGNIIRKLKPNSLTKLEKAVLIEEVMNKINSL